MSSNLSGMSPREALAETANWSRGAVARWRENPERLAWAVLFACFAVFMFLVITIPLTARSIYRYATVNQPARLEPTLGTLLLYAESAPEPVAITATRDDIVEGSQIVAGEDGTQGTLELVGTAGPDEVLGSVQLYPGTVLDVVQIRRPMFSGSPEPYRARLRLEQGQARVFTYSGEQRPLHVELETPHGVIALAAGSYQVMVDEKRTDITVRSGEADLTHDNRDVLVVEAGSRAWMSLPDYSHSPEPAEQNLLRNGDFSEPMLDTWQSYVIADNVIPGSVRIIDREGRRVAHFIRQGEENVPTEVGITQAVEKDVNVYDSLNIQLDVKLLHQSLSGAGYLSSEFPLRVEVTYTDIYGKLLTWGHGFYYRDPDNANWRIINGEKIPPYIWYTYTSPNLIELLKETRPARINSVRIYASGWNYQSMVSEAYLLAK
jgi:hypothetical protein